MASRAYRSAELMRSMALLWTFLLASAAILAVGAIVLSSVVSSSLREQALDDSVRAVSAYSDAVLAPALARGSRIRVSRKSVRVLRKTVRAHDDVTGITVWSRKGRLLVSTLRRRKAAKADDEVALVLRTRTPVGRLTEVATRPGGSQKTRRAVVVWSPLTSKKGRIGGVAEIVLRPSVLDASVATATRTVWIAVAFVFAVLWLALALLVRGASARLSRQNDTLAARSSELLESSRELESSLLDTIETLNAAVEARDPYTAGHSQRVRRVALAIGAELGLSPKQLGTLGTAALFHDVGKIGIPDSILTKPGALEPGEAAIMREHVIRSGEIVAKISSFRDAVPAIRHHHERWDGLGYPDGLEGDAIPVEAAIIGLADAWDAMTTDRPYAVALTLNEALMQIRTGRGTQFNPAVVDAFAEVARRHPAEILPPESPSATVAVV